MALVRTGTSIDVRNQGRRVPDGYRLQWGHSSTELSQVVTWGTLQVKRCVLKSASIAYKLFKPDGIPLRVVITATFTDNSG